MKGGDPRVLEDPLQSLFDLSREVSRMARWSMFRMYVTLLFLLFMIFFSFLMLLGALAGGNVGGAIVVLGLFVAGLMAFQTVLRMRGLFKTYMIRHAAINAVRKQPVMTIPEGKDPSERYVTYLRSQSPAFANLLKARPETLRVAGSLSGKESNHRFDAYVFHKGLRPSGSYLLLIREYARMPRMKDLKRLMAEVADIHAKWKVMPSRVVMVTRDAGEDMEDDLYDALTAGVDMPGGYTRFQLAVESADGSYDFIPLVPELKGFMP